jgi:hypothetical protein
MMALLEGVRLLLASVPPRTKTMRKTAMELFVDPAGGVCCVYGELIELASLGDLVIARASHVEPDLEGHWVANLDPVGGPQLGPFGLRSVAVAAEVEWLTRHRLHP